MSQRPDPYAVLGVTPGASLSVIRRAYFERARQSHPDLVGDAGLETMRQLNAAWAILRDAALRADYDQAAGTSGNPSAARHGATGEGTGKPAWTGAAGRPPGRPSGSRLSSGIYAGWSLGEVARHDSGYLAWLAERKEGQAYAGEIREILARMRGDDPAPSPARGRSRWRR